MTRTFTIDPGMPRAVFNNKYARKVVDETGEERFQTWGERVEEVVVGNFELAKRGGYPWNQRDMSTTHELAKAGVMSFAGRHLQHGDKNQPDKMGEVFTNCSTAMFSFAKFWLLLKGSGVGRCYDDNVCLVDWNYMPNIRVCLSGTHADFDSSWMESVREARHKYPSSCKNVRWFTVGDSAEGWSKVVEVIETASYHEKHKDLLFVFDFSEVRDSGSPISGQQGRPASGPGPFMKAIQRVASIKGAGMKPWKQSMYVDHYLAACVLIGGIRRSSRIAVKIWTDDDILEFIDIKRGGFLWTANNSVGVDSTFWDGAKVAGRSEKARIIFEAMCKSAWYDNTGEPGFINLDKLSWQKQEDINLDTYLSDRTLDVLGVHPRTRQMMNEMMRAVMHQGYGVIVNPCSEIPLAVLGGYCVVGDVCLANCRSLEEAVDGVRMMSQFLVRTNTMNFLYDGEVKRTNRIGVSLMGIHEFAYQHFNLVWGDLVSKEGGKAKRFWSFIHDLGRAAEKEARDYSKLIGMNAPHTYLCTKPGGTVPKVMNITSEGANLPAYAYMIRWVQFIEDDPQLMGLIDDGYPTLDISHQYEGHIAVGFPTKTRAGNILGEDTVTPEEAPLNEQFVYLQRLEKYWLGGEDNNGQISFTLKYNKGDLRYHEYEELMMTYMPTIKCAAIHPMLEIEDSAYAYLPEEKITKDRYGSLMRALRQREVEHYDASHVQCEGGACGIDRDRWSTSEHDVVHV